LIKIINLEINQVLQLDKIQSMEILWWASNKVIKNKQLLAHQVAQYYKVQVTKKLKVKDLWAINKQEASFPIIPKELICHHILNQQQTHRIVRIYSFSNLL
jgi:predicted ATP-grasp superfamily ATP-dependent carboligase